MIVTALVLLIFPKRSRGFHHAAEGVFNILLQKRALAKFHEKLNAQIQADKGVDAKNIALSKRIISRNLR